MKAKNWEPLLPFLDVDGDGEYRQADFSALVDSGACGLVDYAHRVGGIPFVCYNEAMSVFWEAATVCCVWYIGLRVCVCVCVCLCTRTFLH